LHLFFNNFFSAIYTKDIYKKSAGNLGIPQQPFYFHPCLFSMIIL